MTTGVDWCGEWEKKSFELVIAESTRAIELNPNNAEAYYLRAWYLLRTGKAAQALADAQKLFELNPKDLRAFEVRGHILEVLGRLEEAITDFRSAQRRDPQHQLSREGLKRLGAS